ncbi:2,3-diaminopropionate biosynthesis protein SbnB [Catenuloplanes indicus]|uniref:Ornithine cyclodeaminase n=1 Tax=Catenuloplanes indicus TaxID=137267 RepID=A0AAE3VUD0_9ACTN|nr:2,3-diaminopropionate biosynthesis protein SbnB [Catenuloplanes indicus]MDQ0363881.1 ornithine cyclodeaminase [Catenuloplanes indicus]
MLIVSYDEVRELLAGRETEVIDAVDRAYRWHAEGRSTLPHSSFLRLPGTRGERIIGLPAHLSGDDGDSGYAGIKWIASFPGNLAAGLPRASAVVVLNSMRTGRPHTLLEASLISAGRTAASAALAARTLGRAPDGDGTGLIGCGVINFEVLRYLAAVAPVCGALTVFDVDPARAEAFLRRAAPLVAPGTRLTVAPTPEAVLAAHPLVSVATTATTPHLRLDACAPGSLVLHLSLRDIVAEDIVRQHNVVDDVDHAVRESTSLHLGEGLLGHRDFIDATIGDLLLGRKSVHVAPGRVVVFSPFGLGVLDLAVAELVRARAVAGGRGVTVPGFLPGDTDNTEEKS